MDAIEVKSGVSAVRKWRYGGRMFARGWTICVQSEQDQLRARLRLGYRWLTLRARAASCPATRSTATMSALTQMLPKLGPVARCSADTVVSTTGLRPASSLRRPPVVSPDLLERHR